MFELRILSGLHRGAALPLDGRALEIGADDDAGVVLVDPGIETRHATLTAIDGGWTLSALDGPVLGAEHNQPLASMTLQAGEFARLGHVWLCIAGQDDPWENPPPEPAHSEAADAADSAMAGSGRREPFLGDPDDDGPHRDTPLDDPFDDTTHAAAVPAGAAGQVSAQEPDTAAGGKTAAQQPAAPKRSAAKTARGAGWRRSKIIVLPLALMTILSACAAYSITSRPDTGMAAAGPHTAPSREAGQAAAQLAAALASGPADAPPPAPQDPATPGKPGAQDASSAPAQPQAAAAAAAPRKASPQQLREAFRNRLAEVDLLKRINLELHDSEWTMQASLDADEAARFDRILKAFVQAHNIKFPVHARVGGAEVMLPFRVREVISGSNASIVTQDGKRLYVGDEYRGLRLVAVDGNHLQFDGERKIKVKW